VVKLLHGTSKFGGKKEGHNMRWPFKNEKETGIRVFRNPKTDELMLRLIGPMCLPSSDNPIVTLSVQMDVKLDEEAMRRLYQQLSYFAEREVDVS
jgi:hypothetical protein